MRVLDLGCGCGDVTMLAADFVGPDGLVVGIDRSAEVLAIAQERAKAAGYPNAVFLRQSVEEFTDPASFDLVVGRYVLVHQPDPTAFIRTAASYVRPGGTLAFHEVGVYGDLPCLPPVPLVKQLWRWIITVAQFAAPHPDVAGRMMAHFHAAGLEPPAMICEMPVADGPNSLWFKWMALGIRSMLPKIVELGIATPEEVDIDTLEDRLRAAVRDVQGQALGPAQFCGWAQVLHRDPSQ